MDQERWQRIDLIFQSVLELPTGERAAFLERACAGDEGLRREVESLIAHDRGDSFLPTKPLAAFAAAEGAAAGRAARDSRRSPSSSDSIDEARFVPGDVLAERYRIVGLLGRGGMGEVYRADDLKLGQAVALKFLPEQLTSDGAALARFHREVRIARQVSHRNVCRVYDIGESGGLHFLSMEYVRGEELSSVIKRFGRLPSDKAVEVARQLCAGLAAAHDAGVLHRDLKPANVMIDERGDVRITDFGLASLAEETRGEVRVEGTPAYMSPEQFEGRDLTVRSDIYSLGLVLYELFTGRRAFDAASLPELIRLRRSDTTPTDPSSIVRDIDPVVERVILRCMERDPARRPASAIQVAAALPGGDPLAAALAAGETPSPEMVAAAPKQGVLRPRVALGLLAFVLAGLAALTLGSKTLMLHRVIPLGKSPDVLRERVAEITRRAGYDAPPFDAADGFTLEADYLIHVNEHDQTPTRWQRLATGQPAALTFWRREAPGYIETGNILGPRPDDPPNEQPGTRLLKLDTTGRLTYFEAVPPRTADAEAPAAAAPDWTALLREAGFDPAALRQSAPLWTPPQPADGRAAWEGVFPSAPDIPVRIEAASYRGRPVYFEVIGPWRAPAGRDAVDEGGGAATAGFVILVSLFFAALFGGSYLAWRNLRLGLGDRRGAFRVALFVCATRLVHWAAVAHHVPTVSEVTDSFLGGLQSALFWGVFVGLIYLALEPFLRRHWPERVISWSRVLGGDWRDPLVGRDILVGAAFGVAHVLLFLLGDAVPRWLGLPPNLPDPVSNIEWLGLSSFVPHLMNQIGGSMGQTFIVAFLLLFLSMLLRRRRLGLVAGWLILASMMVLLGAYRSPVSWPFVALGTALYVVAVARFGPLALFSMLLFVHLHVFFPITTELSAWYAAPFVLDLLLLLALAAYAFHTSLGGQKLFRHELLDG